MLKKLLTIYNGESKIKQIEVDHILIDTEKQRLIYWIEEGQNRTKETIPLNENLITEIIIV